MTGTGTGCEGNRNHAQAILTTAILGMVSLAHAATAVVAQPTATVCGRCQAEAAVDRDAAVLEFLREADIVANEAIDVGITGPRRLTLERGGRRLRAVFRDVDETHKRHRMSDGTFYWSLRDYCGYEVAAYRLSLLLEMGSIPPTVHRGVRGVRGTVQLWIEGAMMEQERIARKLRPPSETDWARQSQEMLAFDELIGNIDRTAQNFLIDSDWKIWLIDHSRAFQQGDELRDPGRIRLIRRAFWQALKDLDRQAVEDAISYDVDRRRIGELMARRDLLAAHVERLIEQEGEAAVVWE